MNIINNSDCKYVTIYNLCVIVLVLVVMIQTKFWISILIYLVYLLSSLYQGCLKSKVQTSVKHCAYVTSTTMLLCHIVPH